MPSYKGYEGFGGLMYAGMEIVPDRKCTSGYLYMLNDDFIDFYALDADLSHFEGAKKANVASKFFTGNSYNEVSNLGFYWTGFIKVNNAFAFNSFIIVVVTSLQTTTQAWSLDWHRIGLITNLWGYSA